VLIGFVMLFFQAISEIIKRIAVMRGMIPDPNESTQQHPAEAETNRLLADVTPEIR
jgi:TRAP-type mannitol/chloroaromatic compound transport system permease small subunit